MIDVDAEMSKLAYDVNFDPNRTIPYIVRLPALYEETLDDLSLSETRDVLGFGTSRQEAGAMALAKRCRLMAEGSYDLTLGQPNHRRFLVH